MDHYHSDIHRRTRHVMLPALRKVTQNHCLPLTKVTRNKVSIWWSDVINGFNSVLWPRRLLSAIILYASPCLLVGHLLLLVDSKKIPNNQLQSSSCVESQCNEKLVHWCHTLVQIRGLLQFRLNLKYATLLLIFIVTVITLHCSVALCVSLVIFIHYNNTTVSTVNLQF